ncbi:MAG: hypothetical protein JNK82_21370 [Myxococcaceae bacterium]|nr:hypothetical protein [Myxococcaceae bacterium]
MALREGKWKWVATVAMTASFGVACSGPSGDPDGGTAGGGQATAGGNTAGGTGGTAGGAATGGGAATAGGMAGGMAAPQLDVALARFNADGGLDTTFGTNGSARADLGSNLVVWSMGKDSTDRLVVFAGARDAVRGDVDRVTIRFSAEGQRDMTFSGTGAYRLNTAGANLGDNVRNGFVQADGKIVGAGYTPFIGKSADGGSQGLNVPVLFRLDSNGNPDPTFGDAGVAIMVHPDYRKTDGGVDGMAEAYAAARQSNGSYVTGGYWYPRAGFTAPTVDLIAQRVTETGAYDSAFNSNAGLYTFDLVGGNDRARNLAVLPDDRIVTVGSGVQLGTNVDAMVLWLTAGGQLDPTFNAGTGYKLYTFNGTTEEFFGVAVSPNGMQLAATGFTNGGTGATEDATLLLLPIQVGAPAEVVGARPLSATLNDRFWSVAYDADNRIIAAGFTTTAAGNTAIAVARFSAMGALDPTFGGTGVVTLDLSPAGTAETARAVVVQSTGKIVVAGIAER